MKGQKGQEVLVLLFTISYHANSRGKSKFSWETVSNDLYDPLFLPFPTFPVHFN